MAITREKKNELIQMYVTMLGNSQAIVFVQARGLSVAEITQLRNRIRETGASYHVVKNTLFGRALTQAGMLVPGFLTGPISIAFCVEDIAPVVKAIEDFAVSLGEREFEITGGIVDNQVLNSERAKSLSSLPSKDTLFAQILAGIHAPGTQLSGIVANGIRQILNLLQAHIEQLEKGDVAA